MITSVFGEARVLSKKQIRQQSGYRKRRLDDGV
jgi:hypothetical protein